MDTLDSMAAFVTAVDEGGFAAAGRSLGQTRLQISRAIAALETRLGTQLLSRTTRRMVLTEAGQVYLERARAILTDLREAEQAAGEMSGALKGLLRVNAPMSFGVSHIAPAVCDFMERHPEIRASLMLNDRFVDPYEEGFDITLRIGDLAESSLIARKICPIRRLMCASPGYLEKFGVPRTPADLSQHRILHYGHATGDARWPLRTGGTGDGVSVTPAFFSNNGDVLRAAAVAGRGIALLPAFLTSEDIAGERLVAVMDGFEPKPTALHAVYPADRYRPAKVRAFADFLTARFSRRPPGGPV